MEINFSSPSPRFTDSPIHGAGTHGTMFPDLAIRTAGATDARTEWRARAARSSLQPYATPFLLVCVWKWGQPQWEWGRMGNRKKMMRMMRMMRMMTTGLGAPLKGQSLGGIHIETYRNHWFVTWNPLGTVLRDVTAAAPIWPHILRISSEVWFEGKWAIQQQSCTHRMTGRAACETANWRYVRNHPEPMREPETGTRKIYENMWFAL